MDIEMERGMELVHPSEIIKDGLNEVGWTIDEAASQFKVDRQYMVDFMALRCGVDSALAKGLEEAGWSEASFWNRLQDAYDTDHVRLKREQAG